MDDGTYTKDKSTKIHRIVSACVLSVWLVLAFLAGGLASAMSSFLYYLLPIFCIWFPDVLAKYKGVVLGRGWQIDQPSHPTFLRYGGWFVLLVVPLLLMLIFSLWPSH